jgi:hypothetical protein
VAQVMDKLPHYCPVCAYLEWNLDGLVEMVWEYLDLIRVYTKPKVRACVCMQGWPAACCVQCLWVRRAHPPLAAELHAAALARSRHNSRMAASGTAAAVLQRQHQHAHPRQNMHWSTGWSSCTLMPRAPANPGPASLLGRSKWRASLLCMHTARAASQWQHPC